MILKLLLVLGGIAVLGALIYDRLTGRRVARKIFIPLLGGIIAVIVAIAARSYFG